VFQHNIYNLRISYQAIVKSPPVSTGGLIFL
jgi:hypothetical protein